MRVTVFVSSQPIIAGLGGAFVFPVGLRLWSLVHLFFFISQSDCSRSSLFHLGVLSRALPLPFYISLFTQLSGWSRMLSILSCLGFMTIIKANASHGKISLAF